MERMMMTVFESDRSIIWMTRWTKPTSSNLFSRGQKLWSILWWLSTSLPLLSVWAVKAPVAAQIPRAAACQWPSRGRPDCWCLTSSQLGLSCSEPWLCGGRSICTLSSGGLVRVLEPDVQLSLLMLWWIMMSSTLTHCIFLLQTWGVNNWRMHSEEVKNKQCTIWML